MKQEIFAVVWVDLMLGHLSLNKPDRQSAIDAAADIRKRGAGKVENVRAVHVAEGSDELETIG